MRQPTPWNTVARLTVVTAALLAGAPAGAGAQIVRAEPAGRVFLEAEVDVPVRPVRFERPVFPPNLLATTQCGWANLGYIVGPDGRVEPASVVVLRSSHHEFGTAASAAILGSTFDPARRRGVAVRQRVVQRVNFPAPDGRDPTLGPCRVPPAATEP